MTTTSLPRALRAISWMLPATLLAVLSAFAAPTDDVYSLGPDSQPHDGVPKGKVVGPLTLPSQVFTNTTRHYWIYVPAQYDPKQPAALMIFQDGHAFVSLTGEYRIPNVFDNLIYRREMPVTIGVFINPGHRPDQPESTSTNWGDSINNRATEYNELDDNYAKLIVNELVPAIEKDYAISKNPEDRAIAGASSGAICAFTVAWHRPDQFRKVISTIGSFTNLRGGHVYPDRIRESERKPIRIFLQDGLNDNRGRRRNGSGEYDPQRDWHAQNLKMVEALTEKGYDVNYCWGIGTHSNKQGGAIMPEMLRWLWRDYPRPDDPQDDSNRRLLVSADNASNKALPGGFQPARATKQEIVSMAQFRPDGRTIVTTSADGTTRIWDVGTGKGLSSAFPHLGTWQLVSSKYGEANSMSESPKEQRRIKLISNDHFMWVQYAVADGKVQSGAGGSYTLDGDTYTEVIEFAGEGMTDYLGKKQPFKIRVEGDKLYQSGQLSDGIKIEEVWQRMK